MGNRDGDVKFTSDTGSLNLNVHQLGKSEFGCFSRFQVRMWMILKLSSWIWDGPQLSKLEVGRVSNQ